MSRSGYTDDCENVELWRQAVGRALTGKRGQAFLRDMLTALDALPQKRLITDDLVNHDGEVCAIGSVGRLRGIDMSKLDPYEHGRLSELFGISRAMVQEIEYVNDEEAPRGETPEQRFTRIRQWVVDCLPVAPDTPSAPAAPSEQGGAET